MRRSIVLSASIALIGASFAPVHVMAAAKPAKYVDPCAKSSSEVLRAKGSMGRLILQRAAIGGLAAAGLQMLAGGKSNGKDRNRVLQAAVAGAAVGAAAGYVEAKVRQSADVRALAGSVNQDAAAANVEAARALRAFAETRVCRISAATAIKSSLERGEISRELAVTRLSEHRAKLEKEVAAVEQFATDYDNAMDGFKAAAGHIAAGKPQDMAYVAQLGPAAAGSAPKPAPLATARSAANVRGAAAPSGPIVGALVAGESVELISSPNPAWHEVRLANGAKGFVSAKLLSKPPAPPPPPKIDLAKVSEEARTVTQPLFEGVEKRGALQGEIKQARSDMANATFDLAA